MIALTVLRKSTCNYHRCSFWLKILNKHPLSNSLTSHMSPTLTLFESGFIQKITTTFKDFSRTTFDFQGTPTRNVISQIVQKCTLPVHSNRTIRPEVFAPLTSLHFSYHLS